MKFKNNFLQPRWLVLYASVLMMGLGYLGIKLVNFLAKHPDPKNTIHYMFYEETMTSAFLYFGGMFLCLASCLWILVAAINKINKK